MTPQPQPARLKWASNIWKNGSIGSSHFGSHSFNFAAYTYVVVPWSATHRGARDTDTDTRPNDCHVSTSRLKGGMCADEPESFHAWQFCPVRWEAEKIRRQIEHRIPRPAAEIAWTWHEPDAAGNLREMRYPLYSIA